MEHSNVIQISNLKKVFYTSEIETIALNKISMSIQQGEFIAVSGPSGCGKSTLLSIIGLLDSATEGSYKLGGTATQTLKNQDRARIRNQEIGFIFQAFNLISDLNVFRNVELPLTYQKDLSREERKRRVREVLKKVDMAHRENHLPFQLSGGQQQRVAIARALVGNPKLLLADEPTGNLDTKNASIIMDLLSELHADGATICMVTHDPRCAERAQRHIQLLDGNIRQDNSRSGADVYQEQGLVKEAV
jgi:putative ABC transport system ATP-binding protein